MCDVAMGLTCIDDDVQKEDEIQGLAAIRALADLPDPTHTSVSVITGPKV